METSPISAAAFYKAAQPATKSSPKGDVETGKPTGIGDFAAEFAQQLKAGEDTAKSALTGDADMPTLISALASSELAVEMAVTVRDKVVEAYQEILRMPV